MTWLYILIDALTLLALVVLCVLIYLLWNKKKKLNKVSLEHFRNEDLYEKSENDRKKMAHIEETLESDEPEEVLEEIIETDISEGEISFTGGYGGMVELEADNGD